MTQQQVVKAWKNPEFRASLSEAQRNALPANPAGLVELNEKELMEVGGGTTLLCVAVATVILMWPTPAY